ncbi:MAG TPA: hypothetical protein VMT69_14985 [Kineosporiaceae bacterium]|nr:hypothetical protein [Kineosporiaceae bacterium]
MTTHPDEDDGLEATEVPETAHSAFDPDEGEVAEADGPGADASDGGDAGVGNSDPGF